MRPFEVYMHFVAIRTHFREWHYDYFRYRGRTSKFNQDAFDARKDRIFFERVSRHPDPVWLMVSNLVEESNRWVRDFDSDVYLKRTSVLDSFGYRFEKEIGQLNSNFDFNFKLQTGRLPPIVQSFLDGQVTLETVSLLVMLASVIPYWRKSPDPLLQELTLKFYKYSSFLFTKIDKELYREKIIDFFSTDSLTKG